MLVIIPFYHFVVKMQLPGKTNKKRQTFAREYDGTDYRSYFRICQPKFLKYNSLSYS